MGHWNLFEVLCDQQLVEIHQSATHCVGEICMFTLEFKNLNLNRRHESDAAMIERSLRGNLRFEVQNESVGTGQRSGSERSVNGRSTMWIPRFSIPHYWFNRLSQYLHSTHNLYCGIFQSLNFNVSQANLDRVSWLEEDDVWRSWRSSLHGWVNTRTRSVEKEIKKRK